MCAPGSGRGRQREVVLACYLCQRLSCGASFCFVVKDVREKMVASFKGNDSAGDSDTMGEQMPKLGEL